jgi:hypothetical protein
MSEPATTVESRVTEEKRAQTSWTGVTFGIIVFLIGIALLLATFKWAFDQFSVPPENALHIAAGKPLDISMAVQSFAGLIIRVLLLLVMAVVGAIIANRGIKMYTDSRHR